MSDASSGESAGAGSRTSDDPFTRFVDDVDFPGFVADLIRSVYQDVVDASVQQMDAFGDLAKRVGESVGEFVDDIARTGSECLDGLCSARAWANAATDRPERPEPTGEAAQPDPPHEP
jgi:hypothetical protein